eukprot:6181200-Pleurochrysis_carterae.AAC.4
MRGEIGLSPASRRAKPCGCHAATLMARHARLARKCVFNPSSMGEGLPASRRARPCGCRSVTAT